MKAVLVIDRFPESCADCDFITDEDGTIVFKCSLNGMNVLAGLDKRLNNCPLKELPERNTISLNNLEKEAEENYMQVGFNLGWNACLNAIEGTED